MKYAKLTCLLLGENLLVVVVMLLVGLQLTGYYFLCPDNSQTTFSNPIDYAFKWLFIFLLLWVFNFSDYKKN